MIAGSTGRPLVSETISSYADATDAYTAITNALNHCNRVGSIIPIGAGVGQNYIVSEDPRLAPFFVGSEGFSDVSTIGSSSRYQALVIVRRSQYLIEVAVADKGTVDYTLAKRIVRRAVTKVAG